MKFEEKKAIGHLIRDRRVKLNWTQERLAGAADVLLRTVQRAEKGDGISSEGLASIAAALGLDESQLRKLAATAGPPPPEMRIALKQVKLAADLIDILKRRSARHWHLEIGPTDEHRYNELIGEDIASLDIDLDQAPKSSEERVRHLKSAQLIISTCRHMGFGLFAGNYKEGDGKKRTTLILAAPLGDSRIIRTGKGPVLDVARDSRHLPVDSMFSGHVTAYEWIEDQLIAKSDGEERVKDVLRRIMAEVMTEINQVEAKARSKE